MGKNKNKNKNKNDVQQNNVSENPSLENNQKHENIIKVDDDKQCENNNKIVRNDNQQTIQYVGELHFPPGTQLVFTEELKKLQVENIELKAKNSIHVSDKADLHKLILQKDRTIEELQKEIDELRKENEILKRILAETQKQNEQLLKDKKIFEALSKLNDCEKLANDTFKSEYRAYFELDPYDNNIPNLGQFVDRPPINSNANDKMKKQYEFWKIFCIKYPNSDNKNFRMIYRKMSKSRVNFGAHYDIEEISKNEYDDLMKIALPDVYNNNNLYTEYKKWIFLFDSESAGNNY